MSKQIEVGEENGNVAYIRETSDDERTSELYKYDNSPSILIAKKYRSEREKIADHELGGITRAYEVDKSFLGDLINDGRGNEK